MLEPQPSKLVMGVGFSSIAPHAQLIQTALNLVLKTSGTRDSMEIDTSAVRHKRCELNGRLEIILIGTSTRVPDSGLRRVRSSAYGVVSLNGKAAVC